MRSKKRANSGIGNIGDDFIGEWAFRSVSALSGDHIKVAAAGLHIGVSVTQGIDDGVVNACVRPSGCAAAIDVIPGD